MKQEEKIGLDTIKNKVPKNLDFDVISKMLIENVIEEREQASVVMNWLQKRVDSGVDKSSAAKEGIVNALKIKSESSGHLIELLKMQIKKKPGKMTQNNYYIDTEKILESDEK